MDLKMKLNKTLTDLKNILAADTVRAERLTAKKDSLLAALEETNDRILRTTDAISVLEGKGSLLSALKEIQTDAQKALELPSTGGLRLAVPQAQTIPQNGNLPQAEPGFVWQKSETGEDVLVPLELIEVQKRAASNPAPQTAQSFLLPDIDEDTWDNPIDSVMLG